MEFGCCKEKFDKYCNAVNSLYYCSLLSYRHPDLLIVSRLELHTAIARLEACISNMLLWLLSNNLALDITKFEVLLFGTEQQQAKMTQPVVVHIGDSVMSSSAIARNLSVWLDSVLPLDHHVDAICRGCYANIKCFARIWKYLTTESAAILSSVIVASKLDYCNSLLSSVSHFNITRLLQRVQNRLVRVIFKLLRWSYITPYMIRLHWLPIKERIDIKLTLLLWKVLKINQPSYLSELFTRRSACHIAPAP